MNNLAVFTKYDSIGEWAFVSEVYEYPYQQLTHMLLVRAGYPDTNYYPFSVGCYFAKATLGAPPHLLFAEAIIDTNVEIKRWIEDMRQYAERMIERHNNELLRHWKGIDFYASKGGNEPPRAIDARGVVLPMPPKDDKS